MFEDSALNRAERGSPVAIAPHLEIEAGVPIDLGTLGGDESGAAAINPTGQVAGTATNVNGQYRPWRWDGGGPCEFSVLAGAGNAIGRGIDTTGRIVGWCHDNRQGDRATLWHGGSAIALTNLVSRGESQAVALNAAGLIIGNARTERDERHAVVWRGGQLTDLGTLGGATSRALALNDAGTIVGVAATADGVEQATVWRDGRAAALAIPVSGASRALAINSLGWIVGGYAAASARWQASLWVSGKPTTLGILPGYIGSQATGINATGQIIGVCWDELGAERAFLWSTGTLADLNALLAPGSGWVLDYASGINDRGQIIGCGRFLSQRRPFLLDLHSQAQAGNVTENQSQMNRSLWSVR